jgi:hypothetical protein
MKYSDYNRAIETINLLSCNKTFSDYSFSDYKELTKNIYEDMLCLDIPEPKDFLEWMNKTCCIKKTALYYRYYIVIREKDEFNTTTNYILYSNNCHYIRAFFDKCSVFLLFDSKKSSWIYENDFSLKNTKIKRLLDEFDLEEKTKSVN